jgi:hypothetical protein
MSGRVGSCSDRIGSRIDTPTPLYILLFVEQLMDGLREKTDKKKALINLMNRAYFVGEIIYTYN